MIPAEGTTYRRVYDALHATWCDEYCVQEFPECGEFLDQWENGREFTGDDLRLAIIESFEIWAEDNPVKKSEPPTTPPHPSPSSRVPATIYHGEVAGFAGDGRMLRVKMDRGHAFTGANHTSVTSTGHRRLVTVHIEDV